MSIYECMKISSPRIHTHLYTIDIPSRPTRNFLKFHVISPGKAVLRNSNAGCVSSPFTSTCVWYCVAHTAHSHISTHTHTYHRPVHTHTLTLLYTTLPCSTWRTPRRACHERTPWSSLLPRVLVCQIGCCMCEIEWERMRVNWQCVCMRYSTCTSP